MIFFSANSKIRTAQVSESFSVSSFIQCTGYSYRLALRYFVTVTLSHSRAGVREKKLCSRKTFQEPKSKSTHEKKKRLCT